MVTRHVQLYNAIMHLQELLRDKIHEVKLSVCKQAVNDRAQSILTRKLQLVKDEALWIFNKLAREKEEVRRTPR